MQPDRAGVAAARWSMAAVPMPSDGRPPKRAKTPAAAATAAHARAGANPPTCSTSNTTKGAAPQRTTASTSAGPRIVRPTASGTRVCRPSIASG